MADAPTGEGGVEVVVHNWLLTGQMKNSVATRFVAAVRQAVADAPAGKGGVEVVLHSWLLSRKLEYVRGSCHVVHAP
jgi:hypothetical protein